MLFRFCVYGFLKNQRYFEPFLMLILLDRGQSFYAIGWLIAIRELMVNVWEIPSGALADQFGRRLSLVCSFAAYIASFLLLASAPSFGLLAMGMALFGFGDAFRSGTHKAMIFEWLRTQGRLDERTQFYGLTRSWSKLGSAASSLIAIPIVLATGRYEIAFWLSIPCYALNLVNVASYPAELEGDRPPRSERTGGAWSHIIETLRNRSLWPLFLQSMGWEGTFHAIKDYLQPVLQLLITTYLVVTFPSLASRTTESTAVVTGLTYFLLFLLSAVASRRAYEVAAWSGSNQQATRYLWLMFGLTLATLVVSALAGAPLVAVSAFILLHVLQNVWRPILISRLDEVSGSTRGATVLSVEGQAVRTATMLLAPVIGWCVDQFAR